MTQTMSNEELKPLRVSAPKVYVLATTHITDPEFNSRIASEGYPSFTRRMDEDYHNDGEYLIEYAGRNCYQSFHNPSGRTTSSYIANILAQRHFSVLEHTNVTFDIQGVSRAFTHELIRHRHLSFSQLSQRYVDSTNAAFVCPPLFLSDPELYKCWEESIDTIRAKMVQLQRLAETRHPDLPHKVVREACRSIAPNAIETKIVVTGNLRAWREFLEKRWNSHAEAEIQNVARMIREHLLQIYPSTFFDVAYS